MKKAREIFHVEWHSGHLDWAARWEESKNWTCWKICPAWTIAAMWNPPRIRNPNCPGRIRLISKAPDWIGKKEEARRHTPLSRTPWIPNGDMNITNNLLGRCCWPVALEHTTAHLLQDNPLLRQASWSDAFILLNWLHKEGKKSRRERQVELENEVERKHTWQVGIGRSFKGKGEKKDSISRSNVDAYLMQGHRKLTYFQ